MLRKREDDQKQNRNKEQKRMKYEAKVLVIVW